MDPPIPCLYLRSKHALQISNIDEANRVLVRLKKGPRGALICKGLRFFEIMVVSSNEAVLYEYPLKLIEIEEFLYNSDDLLWRSVSKSDKGIFKVKKKVAKEEKNLDNIRLSDFNHDDFYTNSSKIPKNLTDTSQITLVFTESEIYKQHFEKTHLKLINNMIVMDNQINFYTEQEARNFYELLKISKRWLFHGSLKLNGKSFGKDKKRRSVLNKFSINRNQNQGLKLAPQTMDILLILNTTHNFVREQISNGIKKLIKSFRNHTKAIFEIDFSKSLNIFYAQKLAKLNSSFQAYEALNSKIVFKTCPYHISALLNQSQQSFSSLSSINKERGLSIFMNKVKNVMVQKVNKVSNPSSANITQFSLEILPHLLCFLDNNKAQCNYISYNDENFLSIVKEADDHEHLKRSKINLEKNKNLVSSSGSEWSSSVNSSLTGFHSSKSWDCLTDKYFSSYETDNENELEENTKIAANSRLKSKSLYLKNISSNIKSKTSRSINDYSSITNSSLSSFSNFLHVKKKKSDNFLEPDDKGLLDEEVEEKIESNKLNLSPIEFKLNDFKPSNNYQKDQNFKKSLKENNEQFISRHPALVRSSIRSKSEDTINDRSSSKKTILKSKIHLHPINLASDDIEETTKKNTFLNSQLNQNHISRKNECFLSKNELLGSRSKIYIQNNHTMYQSSEDLEAKSWKRPTGRTYSRCCSRQKPKKSCSPPPPIFVSPTGLLPPPMIQYAIKEKEDNLANKRRFNEIRSKFESNSQTKSLQNTMPLKSSISIKHLNFRNENAFSQSSFKGNFSL